MESTNPDPSTANSVVAADTGRLTGFAGDAAQILGLCAMAIVHPLLGATGPNPTYFVSHDVTGAGIVAFVVIVTLAPVIVCLSVILAARALVPRAARHVASVIKGLLGAAALAALFKLPSVLSTSFYLVTAVLLVCGLVVAFNRFSALRMFAAYLSPMTLMFIGLFFFTSASGKLTVASDPETVVLESASGSSVYMLIFDELPTAALITDDGTIDRERFPGFARMADLSTWYPNATTVDVWSDFAVPAIMSGDVIAETRAPVAGQYPQSVYTMLGGSRSMVIFEDITRLCPGSVCGEAPKPASNIGQDTAILTAFPVLPEQVAEDLFPGVGNQWSNFGSVVVPVEGENLDMLEFQEQRLEDGAPMAFGTNSSARYEAFLDAVAAETQPTLGVLHLLIPHAPFVLLPDGTHYNGAKLPGLSTNVDWADDPELTAVALQRFLLQVSYVDLLVDRFLDQLEAAGELDDAMIIVVADHGISFEPGGQRRPETLNERNRHEVLPVPLLIKYPNGEGGQTDERLASTVDVIPTIADQLDLSLPSDWTFDGESLLAPTGRDQPLLLSFRFPGLDSTLLEGVDPVEGYRHYRDLLGERHTTHDLYRVGPHGSLVGTTAKVTTALPGATAVASDLSSVMTASPDDRLVAAHIDVGLSGVPEDAWVAVAINGVVAGVGPVYQGDGGLRLTAMIDPSLLNHDANDVELMVVDADGLRPIKLG